MWLVQGVWETNSLASLIEELKLSAQTMKEGNSGLNCILIRVLGSLFPKLLDSNREFLDGAWDNIPGVGQIH